MPRRGEHSRQGERRVGSARNQDAGQVLFENLEAGMNIEEVMEQFPVSREEIDSLMGCIARSLEKAPSYR
jgi:hypothetical protein